MRHQRLLRPVFTNPQDENISDHPCLRAAEGWLELSNPQEAAAELQSLPASLHNEPETLRLRTEIAIAVQDGKTAMRCASRLAAIQLGEPGAWLLLSSACLHPSYRPDWAIRALRTGLVYLPNHPVLLLALSGMEEMMGNPAEAERLAAIAQREAEAAGIMGMFEGMQQDAARLSAQRAQRLGNGASSQSQQKRLNL